MSTLSTVSDTWHIVSDHEPPHPTASQSLRLGCGTSVPAPQGFCEMTSLDVYGSLCKPQKDVII